MAQVLISLFVLLWSLVGGLDRVTWHNEAPPPGSVSAFGLTKCYAGESAEVWVDPRVPIQVAVHEAAHVVDCFDNGLLDSSPFLVPGSPFCARCNTQIERWASWVHLHPEAALRAMPNFMRLRWIAKLDGLEQ